MYMWELLCLALTILVIASAAVESRIDGYWHAPGAAGGPRQNEFANAGLVHGKLRYFHGTGVVLV